MRFALPLTAMLLAGCGVHDLESCMSEASLRPTEIGVRVAVAQCQKRYAVPYSPNDRLAPAAGPWDDFKAK